MCFLLISMNVHSVYTNSCCKMCLEVLSELTDVSMFQMPLSINVYLFVCCILFLCARFISLDLQYFVKYSPYLVRTWLIQRLLYCMLHCWRSMGLKICIANNYAVTLVQMTITLLNHEAGELIYQHWCFT